jgi:hypothetical protein
VKEVHAIAGDARREFVKERSNTLCLDRKRAAIYGCEASRDFASCRA